MAVVYALTCTITNQAYIGVTSNLAKRFREHRCLLRNGKHHATKLQALWDSDPWGDEGRWVMLELQDANYGKRGALCETEQEWIDHYESRGLLLNASKTSQGLGGAITKMGVAVAHKSPGKRWTPEANEKRRQAQLGIPKGHGAKISATKQAQKQMMR